MGCRDLNAATSQEVFAGPYLGDAAQRAKFSACFQDMTQGFLAFPLCFPGTAVWRARQGRLWILSVLRKGAAASKTAIKVLPRTPSGMDTGLECCHMQCFVEKYVLCMRAAPSGAAVKVWSRGAVHWECS